MLSVALTGGVASGKSTVARIWAEAGIPVVSADELAREAVTPGSGGLRAVAEAFGEEVLTPDGGLDRVALRKVVFADEGARKRLEAILHPLIRRRREAWLREQQARGVELVVSEIPLLFETGMETEFDVTVHVDAPADVRLKRLMEDRELEEDEARGMMDAQLEDAIKRELADFVLTNDSNLRRLRMKALYLLDLLRARARRSEGP